MAAHATIPRGDYRLPEDGRVRGASSPDAGQALASLVVLGTFATKSTSPKGKRGMEEANKSPERGREDITLLKRV